VVRGQEEQIQTDRGQLGVGGQAPVKICWGRNTGAFILGGKMDSFYKKSIPFLLLVTQSISKLREEMEFKYI
jgi:hypothetical protein